MKRKSERYQSRQKTPWDSKEDLTPTQKFIVQNYKEHYMQKHPLLTETGEVEMINSYIPCLCPFCGSEKFKKYGHTKTVFRGTSVLTMNAARHLYRRQEPFLTAIKYLSVNG